jgi:KDO2-lipid IV(A) lauroyltransferase
MKWLFERCLKFGAWLLACVPQPIRHFLGGLLGLLWFDILRIRRRVALENLKLAFPQWTDAQRRRCARQSLKNMGATLLNYVLLRFMTAEYGDRYFIVEGLEHWENARKLGRGVLLLSMHVGQGDLGVAVLSRRGFPFYLISKEFKSAWLNKIWFGIRARNGTRFISFHKSLFDILRAVRENAGIIFVIDQFMGPPSGVQVTFFGQPTGTAKGLAMIAERTESPVLPLYTYRLDDGRNVVVFEKPIPFQDQGEKNQNIQVMTQIYTDKIEEIVRKYPNQWMWIHKRWKTFA